MNLLDISVSVVAFLVGFIASYLLSGATSKERRRRMSMEVQLRQERSVVVDYRMRLDRAERELMAAHGALGAHLNIDRARAHVERGLARIREPIA